jgi:hypothetical protein
MATGIITIQDRKLEIARQLAAELDALLARPPSDADRDTLFRYRLARAHALGLIDQLRELSATSGSRADA